MMLTPMKKLRALLLLTVIALSCLPVFAQQPAIQPQPNPPAPNAEKKVETATPENEKKESAQAEARDEEAQFKESPSVQFLAKKIGVSVTTAYWICAIFNFAVIAGAIIWAMKAGLPGVFRNRTSAIQKGIEEARKMSAESTAKLQDIEARLAKLDQDIASMKLQAEQDAEAEDRRLRAATEEEKKKIIAASEQEIEAASSTARRDLKKYAAELAIALAEKRITVDEAADKNLVREFAAQMDNGQSKGRS
jgi:F-type H+-transporting ATPase subunit b